MTKKDLRIINEERLQNRSLMNYFEEEGFPAESDEYLTSCIAIDLLMRSLGYKWDALADKYISLHPVIDEGKQPLSRS